MRVARKVLLPFLLLALLPTVGMSATGNGFYVEAAFKADQQIELGEGIAKAYLAYGEGVRTVVSKHQLDESLQAYRENQDYLQETIDDPGVHRLLAQMLPWREQYLSLVSAPYSKQNAAKVLELSESLLHASAEVEGRIDALAGLKPSGIMGLASQQGMLMQRIAKFYIACKAGLCDQLNMQLLQRAVARFDRVQTELLQKSQGITEVNARLVETGRLWSLVRRFFLDARSGDVPVMVSATADLITGNMDRLARLTAEAGASQGPGAQLLAADR